MTSSTTGSPGSPNRSVHSRTFPELMNFPSMAIMDINISTYLNFAIKYFISNIYSERAGTDDSPISHAKQTASRPCSQTAKSSREVRP
ncbi:hypothetical protein ACFQYP_07150 [Nonomuraea antimicrobica]